MVAASQEAYNKSQQLTDRSCHGRCMRNAHADPATPDAPAAEALSRHLVEVCPDGLP